MTVVSEWDRLVAKIGGLAIAAGYVEMAIIAMVCRITDAAEDELKIFSNAGWCKKLENVCPPSWSDIQREDLAKRLKEIRSLYRKRSKLIHTALGTVSDGSISGIPAGGIVDLRTYGIGFTKQEGNTWTIGVTAQRVHLEEIDELTEALHKARVGLVPYMELVDKIEHPPKPFPEPKLGKLISRLG